MFKDLYRENCQRTRSGKFVNLLCPNPDDILIEDIALGLSREGRFSNQGYRKISVAEHSIIVCRMVPDDYAFCGLMHDAAEYLLRDIGKPLKHLLPDYKIIEDRLMNVIAEKFGFEYPVPEIVKRADRVALEKEWGSNHIFKTDQMPGWSEEDAKILFMQYFNLLSPFAA